MMEGFGLTPGQQSVENQMAILSSWDLVLRTINQLDFQVSYFVQGNLKHTELYGSTPYTIEYDDTKPQIVITSYSIHYTKLYDGQKPSVITIRVVE